MEHQNSSTQLMPGVATSLQVRERLVDAVRLDLVGPWAGHPLAEERLPGRVRPSNWYLTGFLIPSGTPPERSADTDEDLVRHALRAGLLRPAAQ